MLNNKDLRLHQRTLIDKNTAAGLWTQHPDDRRKYRRDSVAVLQGDTFTLYRGSSFSTCAY
jgi:hypothetical protein